jgi:hypothetical protein
MRALLAALTQRRAALVERSELQRAELVAGVGGVRRAAAAPLEIGLAAALALAGASPRLRAWLVRAWVIGALVKRLLR